MPDDARALHDVVVIGGGIAGLAAAWALRDLDVVVLEAGDRPGGRIRSERRGRYWLNFGAHVVAGEGTATDVLLRETGVEAAPVPGVLTAVELHGRVVAGGRIETYPLRLPLRPRDRLALMRTGLRLRLGVLAYDRMLRSADQRGVLAYRGDESFTDWLGTVPGDVDAILRPTLERSSGEPEDLSAGYGIGYFHLAWDRSGGLARAILGGPATLPEAIAVALGDRVRLRTPVHEVAVDGDTVRVVHEHGELTSRTAVVATPAYATQAIVRTLPDETRFALERIVYGPYVVAAFLTNETSPQAWDGIYALAAARRSFNLFFNSANVLRPREERREPGGSLQVYAAAGLARRLWDGDDADAAAAFVGDLDEAFPGIGNVVAESVVHRWERGLPYVAPGRHRLQAALERPLDPLYLAGDYLGSRYTETAIHTGTAAAAAARARLTAPAS
jgi:protoporphyrinogen/coproporphyrinogen III oxidase